MQKVAPSGFPVLNMLNTRYFIFPLQDGKTVPIQNPYTLGKMCIRDRIKVNINTSGLDNEVTLTPRSVQLCNVPKTCTLASDNSITDFTSCESLAPFCYVPWKPGWQNAIPFCLSATVATVATVLRVPLKTPSVSYTHIDVYKRQTWYRASSTRILRG